MTEYDPREVMEKLLKAIPKEVIEVHRQAPADAIYVIESPSPDDLLHGRNEGDALYHVLKLGHIEVYYYFAATEEMFEQAFEMIAETIRTRADFRYAMPWIHISAHGGNDGLELTDGGVVEWDILTRMLAGLHQTLGPAPVPPPMPQNLPKASLCLSACGAFHAYRETIKADPPFQGLIGPNREIGWCQALVAFSAFYYLCGVMRKPVDVAILCMNIASGALFELGGPAFEAQNVYNERPWTMPSKPETPAEA